MNYGNLIRIAIRALANNKFRGFLTMLGIIIGVASVISMLAIGQGSKRSIREQISEMGSNMIMIRPGNGKFGGVRQSASSMQTLKLEDFEAITRDVNLIDKATPMVNSSGQIIYGANNAPTSVYGINQDYLDIRKFSVDQGEMFTEHDIKTAAKVCVVGQTVVNNLFTKGEDPLGKTIRFKSTPFRIIGVLTPKGYNSMGQDQDDMILAPYTTIQKRILAITYINGIEASAISEEASEEAIEEISAILRQNHKLAPGDEADFHVRSQEELSVKHDDRFNDRVIGMYRGNILACRGYRDHEHHVRIGNGTHAGNRASYVHRGKGTAHPVPVPHRSRDHQRNGRYYRGYPRHRLVTHHQIRDRLARVRSGVFRRTLVLGLHDHRNILRLVPGTESIPVKPDRRHTIRIGFAFGKLQVTGLQVTSSRDLFSKLATCKLVTCNLF